MLSIYILDRCWMGAMIVIANSKEEAIQLMLEQEHSIYEDGCSIEEYPILKGHVCITAGD